MTDKRLYKGEDRPITDIAPGTPTQFLSAFPGATGAWGTVPAHEPDNLVILDSVGTSLYGKEFARVTYLAPRDGFRKRTADLPRDYLVRLLTGRMREDLTSELHAHQARNLSEQIGGPALVVGSDPEIFVENDAGVVPAFSFLPDKAHPLVGKYAYRNNVYWDGFQAEFDTYAAGCLSFHIDSVQAGLRALYEALPTGARLSLRSVVEIDPEILATAEDKHVEFGCAPSKNVYRLHGNTSSGRTVPFRFAGGHLHFGIDKANRRNLDDCVKALDSILGVACVSLFASFDNPVRREYYGLPGEYRLPAHGLEYRTLSNAWLMHPVIAHMVFDLGRQALRFGHRGLLSHWDATQDETVETIAESNVDRARALLTRNREALTAVLSSAHGYTRGVDQAIKAIMSGAESIIARPTDVPGNWDLDPRASPHGGWVNHSDGPNKNWAFAYPAIARGEKV